jgi:WD40-like Beta Propeller Repeat
MPGRTSSDAARIAVALTLGLVAPLAAAAPALAAATERVSVAAGGGQADGQSDSPAISGDGRLIAFESFAGDLVPEDTNGQVDAFVRDHRTGVTRRVSVGRDGTQAEGQSFEAAVSGDGRSVAFTSNADNLVPGDTNGATDVFVRTP